MGFILDGLESEAYDRQYSDRVLVGRIAGYFRPHTRKMVMVALTLTLNSAAGTAAPILISRAIDIVSRHPDLGTIGLFSAAVLMLGVLGWVFNYVRQKITAEVVGDVVLKLRSDVFEHTVRHDMSFFDENPSGKMVSR
ncbi:ABC transporter transmembrane domain-containing protein, partial [Salinispira pacifica]